jgi:TRAP-type C4-dicarboxylate transport system permease small subunit
LKPALGSWEGRNEVSVTEAGANMGSDTMIRTFLDRLYLISGYLAGLFLIAIFLLMMALSIGRELGVNVKSGDDIASWCMAAMAFLGLAHTFRKGELIRMGLLIERLQGPPRRALEIFVLVLGTALVGYFAWHAVKFTYESWLLNDLSSGALVVPLWIPQLGLSVGAVIFLVALVDELVHVLRGGNPHYAKPPPASQEEILERAASASL